MVKIETEQTNLKDKVISDYRQETISDTIDQVDTSLNTLGIDNWDIPNTKLIFKNQEKDETLLLGHVEVYPSKLESVEIVFDERFSTPQKETPERVSLRPIFKSYSLISVSGSFCVLSFFSTGPNFFFTKK